MIPESRTAFQFPLRVGVRRRGWLQGSCVVLRPTFSSDAGLTSSTRRKTRHCPAEGTVQMSIAVLEPLVVKKQTAWMCISYVGRLQSLLWNRRLRHSPARKQDELACLQCSILVIRVQVTFFSKKSTQELQHATAVVVRVKAKSSEDTLDRPPSS